MKKLYALFFLIFISPVFAETVSDFTNMCAETGYKRLYAIFPKNEYTCLPGYFLPADAEECVSCPNGYICAGGTFYYDATNAQGLAKNSLNSYSAAENACASNTMPKRLYAIMTPITYTCLSGQFLPANSTECATCPNGYNCAGGDFPVDTTKAQGLVRNSEYISSTITNACADNQVRALNAIFTINSYTCQPGYYLPAGEDWVNDLEGCRTCPAHSICAGGTYTFNETTTQGITGCESGYNLQDDVCVGNTITINWSDALLEDITANNAGTMTYGGDIRTPRAAIDKTNIGLRFKGWKFNKTTN